MAVSPYTVSCSADARAATSHTSPGSLRSATHAQRLASAGTLVHVLEPPVKEGVNPVRLRSGCMSWSTGHRLILGLPLRSCSPSVRCLSTATTSGTKQPALLHCGLGPHG